MVNQLHPKLDKNIKKYGCYFMSLAFFSGKDWQAEELNRVWLSCIKKGYISGDLNKDGDMDATLCHLLSFLEKIGKQKSLIECGYLASRKVISLET